MRLVEQGQMDLDTPANRYLKRWQVPAGQHAPQKVTVRISLSHTDGLTIHGFTDYSQRPPGDRKKANNQLVCRPSLPEFLVTAKIIPAASAAVAGI